MRLQLEGDDGDEAKADGSARDSKPARLRWKNHRNGLIEQRRGWWFGRNDGFWRRGRLQRGRVGWREWLRWRERLRRCRRNSWLRWDDGWNEWLWGRGSRVRSDLLRLCRGGRVSPAASDPRRFDPHHRARWGGMGRLLLGSTNRSHRRSRAGNPPERRGGFSEHQDRNRARPECHFGGYRL